MLFIFAVEVMDDYAEHLHCDTCIRRKCTALIDPPCAVISCAIFCGAVFHECKLSEHTELCPLQKVPCINAGNGCPIVLRRCDLQKHLAACPASVICCTMEWCRWPMYSRERGTRVQFAPSSLRARCGQLDVALALRDQRMLDRAKRFPRRSLVRALRNSFTKRYPAVPLLVGGNPAFVGENSVGELSFSESDDEEQEASSRAPWLTAKEPPGLQRSILNELLGELSTKSTASGCVSNLTAEDVRCALCPKVESKCAANAAVCLTESVTEPVELSKPDGIESVTACGSRHYRELDSSSNGCTTSAETDLATCLLSSQDVPHSVNGTSTNEEKIKVFWGDGYQPVDANSSLVADADAKTDAVQSKREVGNIDSMSADRGWIADTCSNGKPMKTGEGSIVGTSRSISDGGSLACIEHSSESLPLTLHEVLAVDLNVEVCSRYTLRDPSLYSFICAQLFRRDEYMQHVCDVHSVIHDAIDHWLEVRCPLAHCGCTFSMHRRLPSGANIIFSPLLESLGLQRTDALVSAMKKSTLEELANQPESSPTACSQMPTSEDTCQMGDYETEILSLSSNDVKYGNMSFSSTLKECTQELLTLGDNDASDRISTVNKMIVCEKRLKECTPEMFTSTEFDSAIYMRPRTSKEPTPADDDEVLCLTSLPFELLTRVATFLDSFSLCNLSLTCWLLRDVCRGLLKHRGLVVQEWQRDGSRNPPRWKISHQVSLSVICFFAVILLITECSIYLACCTSGYQQCVEM